MTIATRLRQADAPSIQHIEAAYSETLDLLNESEAYILDRRERQKGHVNARDRVFIIRQEMRITTRLASAMAWLMMRRAVETGEVAAHDDLVDRCDPFHEAACCLGVDGMDDHRVCDKLSELLKKSYAMYARVIEMDTAFRGHQLVMQ